jgi:hypothetical protein
VYRGWGVDDRVQDELAELAVGFAVGGDDALVDTPGRLDSDVVLVGEQRLQPGLLLGGEQPRAGGKGAAGVIERVVVAAGSPVRGLLDAAAAVV